jgi:hypothetical protein
MLIVKIQIKLNIYQIDYQVFQWDGHYYLMFINAAIQTPLTISLL